jgi:phosphoribosylformylglycinamidine synthase
MGQSLWLSEVHGRRDGNPPTVMLEYERENAELVRSLITSKVATAVHDVSDGGIIVAVVEMALASNIGADLVHSLWNMENLGQEVWFAEDQGQYIVTTKNAHELQRTVHEANVACELIGFTRGDEIKWKEGGSIPIADLRAAHDGFFPKLMGSELTPEF